MRRIAGRIGPGPIRGHPGAAGFQGATGSPEDGIGRPRRSAVGTVRTKGDVPLPAPPGGGRAPAGPARDAARALSRNDRRLVANLLSAGLVNR